MITKQGGFNSRKSFLKTIRIGNVLKPAFVENASNQEASKKTKYIIYNFILQLGTYFLKITFELFLYCFLQSFELFLNYSLHLHRFMKILLITGRWVLGWQCIIKCFVYKQQCRTSVGSPTWSQWCNGASKDACCGLLATRSPSSPTAIQHACDGGHARQSSHHSWNFTKHNIKCM